MRINNIVYFQFKAFLEPRVTELENKFDDRWVHTLPKDIEDELQEIEARSKRFHELMDKRYLGPNTIIVDN